MSLPDAELLLADLAAQMRPHMTPDTALVGLHSGGVWVAQRLHALLGLAQPCLLYTSPSPRDYAASRMPSSA